jgi:hypothetical protein
MSYAQGALRSLAMLEPTLIMPELLERAYGGLEVVNETHRTTAVLSMLSGIARPLVTEKIWLGGQRHIVPLLELCIPGIDLVRRLLFLKSNKMTDFGSTERSCQDGLRDDVYRVCHSTHQDWGFVPVWLIIFCRWSWG